MPEQPLDLTCRHLAKVVESSDDAIVTKDLNGIVLSWNQAAERMFGYSCGLAKTLDHYETVRRRKDGALLSISLTVSPIRNDAGEVIGASKIARDITEQSRLQAAARQHSANTQKLSEVGAVVASTLDRDAIVQRVTDIATELTHADLGVFVYTVLDPESGDAQMLYALAGALKGTLASVPRSRAAFEPSFPAEGAVRLDDVAEDPRYSTNGSYFGMPAGHLPVRSYLAVPVKGVSGTILGGLFFGHSLTASSRSSTSGWRSGLRRGHPWRSRTPGCTWTLEKPIG